MIHIKRLNETENRTLDIMLDKKFQTWFKGSKVVDKQGKPLVCFHGTKTEFSNFNTLSHFGSSNAANDIIKNSKNSHIIPVYLSIKNPLEIKDYGRDSNMLAFDIFQQGIISFDDLKQIYSKQVIYTIENILKNKNLKDISSDFNIYYAKMNRGKLIEILKQKGYDGLKYKNGVEDRGSLSWIIFNSNQVWPIFLNKPNKKSKLKETSSNYYSYKEVFSFMGDIEYNFSDDSNKLYAITFEMKKDILKIDIEDEITSNKIENTYNTIIQNFVKDYQPYQIILKQNNKNIIHSLEKIGYEYNNNILTKILKEYIDVYKPIKKNSWNYPEELEDYLSQNEFKQIGAGSFSTVWKSSSKENFVVKVYRSKEFNSSIDKKWYDYCKKNSGNPHLPKVGNLKDFGEWYVIFIEKLDPVSLDIDIPSVKIFKEALKRDLKPTNEDYKDEFMNISYELFHETFNNNFLTKLLETYPTIYDINQKIIKPVNSIQVRLDLHLGNFMLRGNTLVITDPIKSFLRNV